MGRRVARLTVDTLGDLPEEWRRDLFWEVDPVTRERLRADEAAAEKEAWLARVLLEWGSCGRVLYVDGEYAGHVLYAPPAFFAGTAVLPTAPVAEDAVQLATARVHPAYVDGGLGRVLMQLMAKDLLTRKDSAAGSGRRDQSAVECIGVRDDRPFPAACAGASSVTETGGRGAMLPVEFLQRVGFKTQRAHPDYPRMRLDLRSVVSWRTDVEAALERIMAAVRPSAPSPMPSPQRTCS